MVQGFLDNSDIGQMQRRRMMFPRFWSVDISADFHGNQHLLTLSVHPVAFGGFGGWNLGTTRQDA
jgi:hypothetical protein